MNPMNWKAKWIWTNGEPSPKNFWLAVRKVIDIKENLQKAELRITADSRYVLWLNGKRAGQGPVRSWPWNWSFDTYNVKEQLRKGKNVISVLVIHYGVSNLQYIETRGGLLAELEILTGKNKKIVVGTNKTWKGIPHPSYDRTTPRISCTQGWVEHYNARKEPERWLKADFDDSKWENMVEVGRVGIRPWKRLTPRKIPFLTEEPVYPVNILQSRVIEPIHQHFGFDLKPNLLPGDKTAGPTSLAGFAAAILNSPSEVRGRIIHPNNVGLSGKIRVNGEDCPWQGRKHLDRPREYADCLLKEGDNLILWDVREKSDNCHLIFSLDMPFPVSLRAPLSGEAMSARMATLGPIGGNDGIFEKVWNARKETDLVPYCWGLLKEISAADEVSADVFAQTTQVKELNEKPKILKQTALCAPDKNITTLFPPKEGDVELLIDFGREIVGFLEFEIEAAEGTILDFNCFESIQDGEINFCWGLNNTLRYVAIEGRQFYHSVVRRGFRYALLVVRFPNRGKRPLQIRFLRCLLNTYPVTERGVFACSDRLLNQIWKMGAYTTRLCSEDTFVDCPAYEQVFWVGDSRNEGSVNLVAFGEYALSRRSLLLAADSLKRSPLVESQVPSGWQNIIPAWSFLWVLACEEFYRATGDLPFLEEVYPSIAEQNRNAVKMLAGGLFSINAWNMLDWAGMDTPSDALAVTHQNAWYVESLKRSAVLAGVLGRKKDAVEWLKTAEAVKNSINKKLWDEKRKAYIDCIHKDGTKSDVVSQQTNAVVFLCACATAERQEIITGYIDNPPDDFVKAGSPFMMFFIFEALAKLGRFEKILEITREKWGFMIKKGATTCWELFPGFHGPDYWTRSHCHAWSTAPTYFLSTRQLGVTPEETGFGKVRISPEPAGLKWARGIVPTVHGSVKVDWTRDKGRFTMEVSLPAKVPAKITLPSFISSDAKIRVSGDGKEIPKFTGKTWLLETGPGVNLKISARY